jgi:hypothetical protein
MPPLEPEHKVCTSCQEPKPLDAFVNKTAMRDGKAHTCKQCCNEKLKEWQRSKRPRRTTAINRRPGRWILKPCEFCGEEFNVRQMIKHLPRCPKNTNARGPKVDYAPLENMKAISDQADAKRKANARYWNLKVSYGITPADYDRMLAEQEGRCFICREEPTMNNRSERSLHVDHDHATGQVRGLLCTRCNHLVGNCLESEAILDSPKSYLRSYAPKPQLVKS